MSSKSYLNFDLLLNEMGDSYQAHVIDSPAGQASRTFTLPFSAVELENFILKIGQNRGNVRSLHIETIDVPSIKKLGGALYEALFSGAVAERFSSSLAIARHEGKGLRIRLRLSGAPKLIDIPWELLFDAANGNYIGLSVNTPIIRKLDLATLPEMRQVQGALQVLVMISSPSNYPQLDVEREWDRINTATLGLQKEGRLILTRVEPSLAALQRQVRQGEYHVFHYIGHGGFDRTNNDGVLVLEDRNKKGDLVSGQDLGTILYDETTLQLVLLNSCSGGRTSVTDPFAGVGQSLLQKSIPAVIAMQFEISDEAAITFSHEFYAALVDGYSIDAAVAEARKMIYAEANQLEWATPVLYTSIDSGSLLREPPPEELQRLEEQRRQREEAKPTAQPQSLPEQASAPQKSSRKGLWVAGFAVVTMVAGAVLYLKLNGIDESVVPIEPEMVSIPAGTFTMGCVEGRDDVAGSCVDGQKSSHKVTLRAFQMGKYEVTFDEWDACEKAHACPHAEDDGWGRGKRPVIHVSWNDITQEYIPWLNQKTHKAYRLPTEAEWEYAARGGADQAYPWGNSLGKNNANCRECGSQWDNEQTAPVGSFAANGFGLFDASGNVWEWVADCWHDSYQGASPDGGARDDCGGGASRVVRGGSWLSTPWLVRSAFRLSYAQGFRDSFIGFRLVLP
jgi:formylglycine-generating enzyme required for sulfatase activity